MGRSNPAPLPPDSRTPLAAPLFQSFFIGGFEGSTHRRRDGKRLDVIAATGHDRFARQDYARLHEVGIRTARDVVRWHLVEDSPGRYDWGSVLPMLRAALETRTQVVWDLLHFGWPDGLDVFSEDFPARFARFARAFAEVAAAEGAEPLFVAPVNEISFLSFAGGDAGFFYPFAHGRGSELKARLVAAAIAACDAIRDVTPTARIVHTDPIINIVADPARPQDRPAAEGHRLSQFEAWDMIAGRARPELGGSERYLDILGVNYYIHNQWTHEGALLLPSHPQYRPVREMLREVWERYRRPLFIAETGIEGEARGPWLDTIAAETRAAFALGVPLEGVCLYPIVNHPGWDDDRHCPNGLWDYADAEGNREIYEPLARELRRHQGLRAGSVAEPVPEEADLELLDTAAQAMKEVTDRSREG